MTPPVLEATPEPDTSNPKEPTSTTMMAHHPRFRVSVWPVTPTISVPVQRLIVQVFPVLPVPVMLIARSLLRTATRPPTNARVARPTVIAVETR